MPGALVIEAMSLLLAEQIKILEAKHLVCIVNCGEETLQEFERINKKIKQSAQIDTAKAKELIETVMSIAQHEENATLTQAFVSTVQIQLGKQMPGITKLRSIKD